MPVIRPRPAAAATFALFAVAALLAGCTDAGTAPAAPTQASPTAQATTRPTARPTPHPTATPTPTASPTPRPTSRPAGSTPPAPTRTATGGQPIYASARPGGAADLSCQSPEFTNPRPTFPARPYPTPAPIEAPAIPVPDAAARDAITAGAAALEHLRSYRFEASQSGRTVLQFDTPSAGVALKGTLTHGETTDVDAQIGVAYREFGGAAGINFGDRIVASGDSLWDTGKVSWDLEPARGLSASDALTPLLPESLVRRAIVPFAPGFARDGDAIRDGQPTIRYRLTTAGGAAYAAATKLTGMVAGFLWLARDDGHVVSIMLQGVATAAPAAGTQRDGFTLKLDVTAPDDPANVVEAPRLPVDDPPVTSAPVDLRLEFDLGDADAIRPTAADVENATATIRSRLETFTRPIVVESSGSHIAVIDCRTTSPDVDVRMATSAGLLTVVPLPPASYGTAAKHGPTPLPTAGSRIDTGLAPLGPGGTGSADAHVDPKTGLRGLAVMVRSPSLDDFVAWAKAHPGEFVALVLDGTVLATLPVADRVAQGHFVFAGTFTAAQQQALVREITSGAITFPIANVTERREPSH